MAKLTEEQLSERLEELKNIKFDLDVDPVAKGLNSLNGKIAEVQANKSRVSYLVGEAMQNVAAHEIEKESVQGEYDRNLEMLLATDATVAAQKSAEMRNTHAKMKMTDLVLKLHHAEIASIRAGWYMKILQNVHSNLESANNNLSRQITVIQMDQNLQGGNNGNNNFQRGTLKNINI
jgi:hypothetical protein